VFHDPYHWFPSTLFSYLFVIVFFGVALIDTFVIRRVAQQGHYPAAKDTDRSSYTVVQVTGILAIIAGVACRYMDWVIAPAWVQWVALAIAAFGIAFREWAVITLGRNFSRTVEIKEGQRLVTSGPYRRIRHPAYTGMVLIYIGLALALGSWLGGILAAVLILSATLYRIRVEEPVLVGAFGEEYKAYMQRTWKLFPGW
jgi:protein-S-isoprenylcysteine O-methyltransferase Ste14